MTNQKLFIQIPCFNEESTISEVLQSLPIGELKDLGLKINIVVIDDGSSDQSIARAKSAGADYVINHPRNLGLAKTFLDGLKFCLSRGADFIVNLDADGQYDSRDLISLIKPVLKGQADMAIGDRQVNQLKFMPIGNRLGNQLGSWVIRRLTNKQIPDASSGFRVFTRELALHFNLHSTGTYTHETIIQACEKKFRIISPPIKFNKRKYGKSRLIGSLVSHITKSFSTIIRTIFLYRAFKYLTIAGSFLILLGIIIIARFLNFFFIGQGNGHVQSLILSSNLIVLGFITIVLGILADLISVNRNTLEEIRLQQLNK